MDHAQTALVPTSRRPDGPSGSGPQFHRIAPASPPVPELRRTLLQWLSRLALSLLLPLALRAGSDTAVTSHSLNLTQAPLQSADRPADVWDLCPATLRQLAVTPGTVRIRIPLPNAAPITAALSRRTTIPYGRSSWDGVIEGIPGSHMVLAANAAAVAGSILIPEKGNFSLVPTADSKLRIRQTPSHLPLPCGTSSTPFTSSSPSPDLERFRRAARLQDSSPPTPPPASTNAPVQLDLLVAYTSSALLGAGGLPGILAQIDASVAEANLAFQNSSIPITLRLTQAILTRFNESGRADRDLAVLTHVMEEVYEKEEEEEEDEDGYYGLGEVASARRSTHSDLVCLLVEGGDNTVGVGNQLWEPKPDFAPRALSVIQRGFLNHFQILAHEIGHNLGCQHERAATPSHGVFPYSHGYRLTLDGLHYRTIMATLPGVTLPNYSNPDVTFLGKPTGVDAAESDGADNARTLRATAPIAAQFSDFWLEEPELEVVTLVSPEPGSGFALNEYAEFEVRAPAGMVVNRIDYYADGLWLGGSTHAPYRFQWTSAKAGKFLITARATTPAGQTDACVPIPIQFSMPPIILLKPVGYTGRVWIDKTMECRVETHDPDGTIVRVDYYADDYRIGSSDTTPFTLTWEPKWAQSYVLTARAIDNTGVSRTSNELSIQVLPTNPTFELSGTQRTGSGLQIPFTGKTGMQCRLETSQDLQTWTLVRIVTLGITPEWTPAPDSTSPVRSYRLVPVP